MKLIGLFVPLRHAGFCVSKLFIVAILASMLCCCFIASAQVNSDSAKVHQLQKVEIWASGNSLLLSSPTPAQTLKGAALERLNALSVADAIRYFSGTQLKDYGGVGGLKTVDVRSLGSTQVAVFYDGIQLGNAQNGQVDLSKFSMDNLAEIEIYNAQKSSIFQPARGLAAGSSIYLTAKNPSFLPNQFNVVKAGVRGGSFGLFNPSLLWQHKLSNSISSSISTEWTQANGRYKFRYTNGVYDTTATRQNGDINALRLEAGLNGKLRDSSAWTVKAYLYNSERGLPGAAIANKFEYSQREWDRNAFIQSSYTRNGKLYSLMLHGKYTNDYTRYLDPEIVTTEGLSDSKYYQQELYFSAVNQFSINRYWTIALSADYLHNTMQANTYRFTYPTRNTWLTALATQLQWKRLNVQTNLLGNFIVQSVRTGPAGEPANKYTPAVMAFWQPLATSNLRLRGFYKSIYRIPTFNELYYTFIGSANLRPEFSKQYDAGITYQNSFSGKALKEVSIQTDVYYNQVHDKIVAVPGQNLRRWTMQNFSRVAIKGLETNVRTTWQIAGKSLLNTGLSYTYQQALDVTLVTTTKQQIPYVPLHSGTALAGFIYTNWAINYSFVYTGKRYNQAANIPENLVQPWYTHDISINWQNQVYSHQVKIGLDINNLLNQYYDVIANYPMPGRYYRFKLNVSF